MTDEPNRAILFRLLGEYWYKPRKKEYFSAFYLFFVSSVTVYTLYFYGVITDQLTLISMISMAGAFLMTDMFSVGIISQNRIIIAPSLLVFVLMMLLLFIFDWIGILPNPFQ